MARSRDWDELAWTWTEWRRKSGRTMREPFEQIVDLTNDAAKFNSKFDLNSKYSLNKIFSYKF